MQSDTKTEISNDTSAIETLYISSAPNPTTFPSATSHSKSFGSPEIVGTVIGVVSVIVAVIGLPVRYRRTKAASARKRRMKFEVTLQSGCQFKSEHAETVARGRRYSGDAKNGTSEAVATEPEETTAEECKP
ncbi:hypothetical protein BDZ91DRAFT_835775 [Kalaharituber pfeilii]|nr:hypothetical protein BDZ91DRAFT_835775 [Kalaharituber pfeilii]